MRPPKKSDQEIGVIPFTRCIAKTISIADKTIAGATVVDHCMTVGIVARELLNRMRPWLRESLFPAGSELIAALHDIGKVSPGFQTKILEACGIDAMLGVGAEFDRVAGFHTAVGAAALKERGDYIAEIVGRHHGASPAFVGSPEAELYGGVLWQAERENLFVFLQGELGTSIPSIANRSMADAISGLVTVSDWIGSGEIFSDHDYRNAGCVAEALDEAGFVAPAIRKGLSFKEIFGFEQNAVQGEFQELIHGRGVFVVEAPMGLGKTEAALYAGYMMLEQGLASGIYFALPTRATSDRMCERMDRFLDGILEPDSPQRKAHLLHGTAWLHEIAMGEDAAPGGSWFDYSKRGILAPFCVGTIDQALLAVMNVRHGFVRSFGLAGKVVILDEVHSYDCYTGTLLDALVTALEELCCTVVILSATLTKNRRKELVGSSRTENDLESEAYPLISAKSLGFSPLSIAVDIPDIGAVSVRIEPKDDAALDAALERAAAGQQVLWIENTVDEAQKAYSIMAARASELHIPCGLLHSRFLLNDRERKEAEWVALYGKEGFSRRRESGRILVGTQVLEQSLDIDADFLVSRLAPMDMLLQRIGRLWRHRDNDLRRREIRAVNEVWILSPGLADLEADPSSIGKSSKVYAPYVLCRTLEVLEKIENIALPRDIRGLLEATYEERLERDSLKRFQSELGKEREKLRRLARCNVGTGGVTIADQGAPTRYAEIETRDLLLIRSMRSRGGVLELETLDGERLRFEEPAPASLRRRNTAASLLRNVVAVPVYLAPPTPRVSIRALSPYLYLGQDEESAVAVGIVGEDQFIRTVLGEMMRTPHRMSYGKDFGYRSVK